MAPSLASSISWLCVSIRQVARICGQGERPCWLLQLPSSTRFSGVSGADQTTPSTASTRSGWRTFTAGRLQAWVNRPNSSAKGSSPRRWRACTLTLGAGGACPSRLKSSCCTTCHSGRSRNSASPITSHTACSAGSLRRRMEALPLVPSACAIQVGSINALSCSRRSGTRGRVSRKAFASRLIKQKRERVEHVPFLLDQAACGLN